ncbi:hypothetical protein V6N12_010451 [Hibiscus sabdariffa]|uniref:Uncharacterized protein n=1 Tax=Hibiscus sabdariffa TaxID=183260 RepID=A0ABR2ELL6_9ROSI
MDITVAAGSPVRLYTKEKRPPNFAPPHPSEKIDIAIVSPRTPCADSRPLGAGGKRTIGGRKAPLGATPAHHVQTQGPSVREASTPWAGGTPPRCGRQAHHRRRKAPSSALLPHTMSGLKAPLCGRKAPSGATPAHHVRTQGPSVREASTPGAGGRPRRVLLPHTMCGLKAPRCGRQSLHVRAQGPSVWEACTPYAGGKGPLLWYSRTPCGGRRALGGHHRGAEKKCPHFRHTNVYWEQTWNVFLAL